jgi:acyl-coenzyme A thioesterase 13
MNAIRDDFAEVARPSPFNALVGPLYQRRAGTNLSLGMRVEEKHTNSRGICHGGVLATLADLALGYAMQAHTQEPFFTAQLSIDYAGSAKVGDWIESEVHVQRIGSRLAFVNGFLLVGGERIVRASALFARPGKDE